MFVKTTLVILVVILINGAHSWPRVHPRAAVEEDLGQTLLRPREDPPQNQLDPDTQIILVLGLIGGCLLLGLCCCCFTDFCWTFFCLELQATEQEQPEVLRPTGFFHPRFVIGGGGGQGTGSQPCCPAGQEPPMLEQIPKVIDLTPKPVLLEQFSKVQDLI